MFIAKFEGGGHMKILDKAKKVGEKENFIPDFTQNVLTYNLDSFIEKYSLPAPDRPECRTFLQGLVLQPDRYIQFWKGLFSLL